MKLNLKSRQLRLQEYTGTVCNVCPPEANRWTPQIRVRVDREYRNSKDEGLVEVGVAWENIEQPALIKVGTRGTVFDSKYPTRFVPDPPKLRLKS